MSANARHSSETNEQYTPAYIIERVRKALGGSIDLDPASTPVANRLIKAGRIFTPEDDGLDQPWDAKTVFVNPPGGIYDTHHRVHVLRRTKSRKASCTISGECGIDPGHMHLRKDVVSSAAWWWAKFMREVQEGQIERAVFLGFSIELLATTQKFSCGQPLDFQVCILRERIPFYTIVDGLPLDGNQPTHSNVLISIAEDDAFRSAFSDIGYVSK